MTLTITVSADTCLDLHKGAAAAVADFLAAKGDLTSQRLTADISWRLDDDPVADEALPRGAVGLDPYRGDGDGGAPP